MKKKMIRFKEIAIREGDRWEMKENYRFPFDDFVVNESWNECPSLSFVKFFWKGKEVVEALLNAAQIKAAEEALFES